MKRAVLNEHIDSILYLEGTTGYTTIYFTNQKPLLYAYPLIRFAELMPTLIRTHRKYLVNPGLIETFRDQGLLEACVVIGDQTLPVSRRRVGAVRAALLKATDLPAQFNDTKNTDQHPKPVSTCKSGLFTLSRQPINIFATDEIISY